MRDLAEVLDSNARMPPFSGHLEGTGEEPTRRRTAMTQVATFCEQQQQWPVIGLFAGHS